jgi:hypothetical protein
METARFHFDVLCPWSYQTSRWARRLEQLGEIAFEWGVFSLEVVNLEPSQDPRHLQARSAPALTTAVLIGQRLGRAAIGPFYEAVGKRIWEQAPPEPDMATAVKAALDEVGLEPGWCDEAMSDAHYWEAVLAEHEQLVEMTGTFGVPTIVLDRGDGPAIFGPVIAELPSDEDAVEMWRHVSWLTRHESFSELKRGRPRPPELPAVTWSRNQASGA